MSSSFEIMHTLHNKWIFMQLVKEFNLNPPETHLVSLQRGFEEYPV